MRADISRLDLAGRRRSLIAYTAGTALYALVVVAIYPAFKDSNSLDRLITNNPTAAALLGVTGSITAPGGWLNANLYANFIPLIMLLITVGYGAAAIAGQDEDGTLCLLATLPVRRSLIVAQKTAAMVLQAAVVAIAVGLCVIAGRSVGLTVSLPTTLTMSLAVLLLGLDFGIIAMAVGAITGKRGVAIGVATAIAAASYLVSSLATTVSWIRPAQYISLFYWTVANNQVSTGVSIWDYLVTVTVGLLGLSGTVLAFNRLDLH